MMRGMGMGRGGGGGGQPLMRCNCSGRRGGREDSTSPQTTERKQLVIGGPREDSLKFTTEKLDKNIPTHTSTCCTQCFESLLCNKYTLWTEKRFERPVWSKKRSLSRDSSVKWQFWTLEVCHTDYIYIYHIWTIFFEFDHVACITKLKGNQHNTYTVSSFVTGYSSFEICVFEILLCHLLCANCHNEKDDTERTEEQPYTKKQLLNKEGKRSKHTNEDGVQVCKLTGNYMKCHQNGKAAESEVNRRCSAVCIYMYIYMYIYVYICI